MLNPGVRRKWRRRHLDCRLRILPRACGSRFMTRIHTLADQASSGEASHTSRRIREHDGLALLGDIELLAAVLGARGHGGAVALASDLLQESGGVGGLVHVGLGELTGHPGVGPATAARLIAAFELGRRAVAAAAREASPRLFDQDAVVLWARPRLAILDHEELWLLALDGRHGLRAARRVASGGIHGLHVGVRDVLRIAVREAASSFVLVHNHPSGSPSPSPEDLTFTAAVVEGAATVGTPLVDHVIIARERFSSLLALGLLTPGRGRT